MPPFFECNILYIGVDEILPRPSCAALLEHHAVFLLSYNQTQYIFSPKKKTCTDRILASDFIYNFKSKISFLPRALFPAQTMNRGAKS